MSLKFGAYLVAIVAASLAGGLIPLARDWSRRSLLLPVSFSGGVLLGAVFFHMIPESASILRDSFGWPILAGFLVIFSVERFILVHPDPEGAGAHGHAHHIHIDVPPYRGISFHTLLDGLAITSAYQGPEIVRG